MRERFLSPNRRVHLGLSSLGLTVELRGQILATYRRGGTSNSAATPNLGQVHRVVRWRKLYGPSGSALTTWRRTISKLRALELPLINPTKNPRDNRK